MTEEELMVPLRLHGQDSPEGVVKAVMEGDGQVSVILRKRQEDKPPHKTRT